MAIDLHEARKGCSLAIMAGYWPGGKLSRAVRRIKDEEEEKEIEEDRNGERGPKRRRAHDHRSAQNRPGNAPSSLQVPQTNVVVVLSITRS